MVDEGQNPRWYESTKNQQLVAAALVFGLMLFLAYWKKWPFHQQPADLGDEPSIWEILLNERVTLGLIRAGLAAVVTYAVVSVPALIVGGRWMKGLTTSGVTADDADTADKAIEVLQKELKTNQEAFRDEVRENELSEQLLLQMQSELESQLELQAELQSRLQSSDNGDDEEGRDVEHGDDAP